MVVRLRNREEKGNLMPRLVWKAALAAAVVILVTVAGGAVAKGAGGSHAVRFAKIDPALYASDGAAGKFTPASLRRASAPKSGCNAATSSSDDSATYTCVGPR